MRIYIDPTDLRKDITYIISTNWIRFIILGFIPFILLVVLYANIYTNLQKRKKRSNGKLYIMTMAPLNFVAFDNVFCFDFSEKQFYILIFIDLSQSVREPKEIPKIEVEDVPLETSPGNQSKSKFYAGICQRIESFFNCQKQEDKCNGDIYITENMCEKFTDFSNSQQKENSSAGTFL